MWERIIKSLGTIDLDTHCFWNWNSRIGNLEPKIELNIAVKRSCFIFRNIKGFIVQTGDPTGTYYFTDPGIHLVSLAIQPVIRSFLIRILIDLGGYLKYLKKVYFESLLRNMFVNPLRSFPLTTPEATWIVNSPPKRPLDTYIGIYMLRLDKWQLVTSSVLPRGRCAFTV